MTLSIVFLVRSMRRGGAERQLVALARALRGRGHAVTVATLHHEGEFLRDLSEAGIEVYAVGKRGAWGWPRALWRLMRFLRGRRPDLLHGYTSVPNLLALLLKPVLPPGCRVVWGIRASDMDFRGYDALTRLTFRISCILARFSDRIIVNSWSGAEYHRAHGYPEDLMTVIPNGIDTEHFMPDAAAAARIRTKWSITDGTRVVGHVGRIERVKDHETFLRAAALMIRQQVDAHFVCVGDGPPAREAELRDLCERLGLLDRVHWIGPQNDMRSVYNGFDLCCSSSIGEGFSNVLGEAMACGVPCVSTSVGDAARIIGSHGKVVPPRDPERLAAALRAMLDGTRDEDRRLTRQFIVDHFSIERLLHASEIAFSELAGQRAVSSTDAPSR